MLEGGGGRRARMSKEAALARLTGQVRRSLSLVAATATARSNRYTRLENLAWSHAVFWQVIFCRKRRITKPLFVFSVDTYPYLSNTPCPYYSKFSFVSPSTETFPHC